eukprot:gene8751-6155_t
MGVPTFGKMEPLGSKWAREKGDTTKDERVIIQMIIIQIGPWREGYNPMGMQRSTAAAHHYFPLIGYYYSSSSFWFGVVAYIGFLCLVCMPLLFYFMFLQLIHSNVLDQHNDRHCLILSVLIFMAQRHALRTFSQLVLRVLVGCIRQARIPRVTLEQWCVPLRKESVLIRAGQKKTETRETAISHCFMWIESSFHNVCFNGGLADTALGRWGVKAVYFFLIHVSFSRLRISMP